jgi:hypothetical protein
MKYLVSTVDVNEFGAAAKPAAPVFTNEEEVEQIRWGEPHGDGLCMFNC